MLPDRMKMQDGKEQTRWTTTETTRMCTRSMRHAHRHPVDLDVSSASTSNKIWCDHSRVMQAVLASPRMTLHWSCTTSLLALADAAHTL